MDQLSLSLQVLSNTRLCVQVDQIDGMGHFLHQPTQKPVESLRWAATDGDVQI